MTPTPKPTPTVCPTCQFEGGEHQRECEKVKEKWEVILDEEGTPMAQFQKVRTDAVGEMIEVPEVTGILRTGRLYSKLDACVRSIRAEDERKVVEIIEQKCPIIERMTTIKGELWIKLPQLEDDDTELMILPKSVLDIIKSHYKK